MTDKSYETDPEVCPWSLEQLQDEEFLAEA
jgi:hypothetical protein